MTTNQKWNAPITQASRARRAPLDLTKIETRIAGILDLTVAEVHANPMPIAEGMGIDVVLDADARRIYASGGGVVAAFCVDTLGIDYATRKAIYDAVLMIKGSPRLLDIDIDEVNSL